MEIETQIIVSGAEILEKFAVAANKTFPEVLTQAGRGAVHHAISITPPASASGVAGGLDSGSEAKQRGYATIHRDLYRAFAPVRLKHKRRERISAADMVTIHRRLLAQKRPGALMKRDRGQPYYVDQQKLRAMETDLRANVGKLAAGWMPAAQALNVRGVPAWISRHGLGRGSVTMSLEGPALYIQANNSLSSHAPSWVGPETQRRAHAAVQYALNDLTRQMPHLLAWQARQAGLEVA